MEMTQAPAAGRTIERPLPLKEAAYRQIKDLLLSARLEHDRFYSAAFFAAMLGVSRTPAREALLQLTGEGFLVCHDVRGFKIKDFTAKEIQDVFETRRLIETHAMERLVVALSPEDLRDLEQAVRTMRGCAARGDAVAFLEADRTFHMIPVRRAGNAHLEAIMENIRNHISLFGLRTLVRRERFREVIREHTAILTALRRQQRGKAVQAMIRHLERTQHYWNAKTGSVAQNDATLP